MKHKLLDMIEKEGARELVDFKPGDTVNLGYTVKEGEKSRVQYFQGLVISKTAKNFTLRKKTLGIGIEKVVPLNSPLIATLEIVKRGKVRRAKLYYLRDKLGKDAKIKERV